MVISTSPSCGNISGPALRRWDIRRGIDPGAIFLVAETALHCNIAQNIKNREARWKIHLLRSDCQVSVLFNAAGK